MTITHACTSVSLRVYLLAAVIKTLFSPKMDNLLSPCRPSMMPPTLQCTTSSIPHSQLLLWPFWTRYDTHTQISPLIESDVSPCTHTLPTPPSLSQDVDEDNCYRYPQLYIAGQQNKNFNIIIFVRSLIKGIYVAVVFFFILFGLTFLNFLPEGYEWDYQSFGVAASGALTVIVNFQVCTSRNCSSSVKQLRAVLTN